MPYYITQRLLLLEKLQISRVSSFGSIGGPRDNERRKGRGARVADGVVEEVEAEGGEGGGVEGGQRQRPVGAHGVVLQVQGERRPKRRGLDDPQTKQ